MFRILWSRRSVMVFMCGYQTSVVMSYYNSFSCARNRAHLTRNTFITNSFSMISSINKIGRWFLVFRWAFINSYMVWQRFTADMNFYLQHIYQSLSCSPVSTKYYWRRGPDSLWGVIGNNIVKESSFCS